MFVKIIQAKVRDRSAVMAEVHRWKEELRPQAVDFLGSTSGVTTDGELIILTQFESEDAARRSDDRLEQKEWWQRVSSKMEGEATLHESSDVMTYRGGGDSSAGFVQVMRGRIKDVEAARRLSKGMEEQMPTVRPDILGGLTVIHDVDAFTDVVYFTSLEEARRNESAMSEDPPAVMRQWGELLYGEIAFYDLEQPYLISG